MAEVWFAVRVVLPGVLVTADLVGSSGFRARAGQEVSLALEAYCRHRVPASDDDRRQAVRRPQHGEPAAETVLTGIAVPFTEPCQLGGWILDVADVPVHVTEASSTPGATDVPGVDDRAPGSDPADPLPSPHTWVCVRGSVSVADDYIVDEVEQALHRPARRAWLVQRIVRLIPAGHGRCGLRSQAAESVGHTGDASSYLLDLDLLLL